ncbi:MAG: hypothetical protein QXJ28_03405 [Candidatus Pacearchaeota archaeon]
MVRKAQVSIELIIVSIATILFFSIFFISIQINIQDKQKKNEIIFIENFAFSIREEIQMAFSASDGYSRNFEIPQKIFNRDYEISILDDSILFINTTDSSIALEIGVINGSIKKGLNVIRKENGVVYLNK